MDNAEIETLNKWLKILSDPTRLHLLEKIIQGVRCNCELGADLFLAPNLISHHLAILKEAGLISSEHDINDARWIHYSVNTATMDEVKNLLGEFFSSDRIQVERTSCRPVKKNKANALAGVATNE